MSVEEISATQHRIQDTTHCRVAVLSDLHKYSGVSDFSKGDNPFFGVYYAIYRGNLEKDKVDEGKILGTIDKNPSELTENEKREIEQKVKENYSKEWIEDQINIRFKPAEKARLIKKLDDDGTWARRQEVFESFKNADYVILNGDIFDIECCKNPEQKINEAVEWLKKRMDEAPGTQFHFVLGNHESFKAFIGAMEKLERDGNYAKRFHFHEHYFQLNDSLFVHGDEYLGVAKYVKAFKAASEGAAISDDVQPIELKSNEGSRRRELSDLNPLSRKAYEWANGVYHKTQNIWHGRHNITSVLYDKIQTSDTEGLSKAFEESSHVFSGHTHEPYSVHFKNKIFYNTGAAVTSKFSDFHPLCIQMEKGKTTRVEPLLQKDKDKAFQRPMVKLEKHSTQKYCVLSDLHMFGNDVSRYDSEDPIREAVETAIEKADVVVLNGDLFELRYTRNVQQSVDKALAWLKYLAEEYPEKEIHFVLGNHEAVDTFATAVKDIGRRSNNFFFHEHAFQPNEKTVFVHGDEVINGKFHPRKMYTVDSARISNREQKITRKIESPAMGFVKWMRNSADVAKNVVRAIEHMPEVTHPEKVENVFLGHTHVPFVDQAKDSKWVTNTGGATHHAAFAGVLFDMAQDGTITTPQIIPHNVDVGVVPVPPRRQR